MKRKFILEDYYRIANANNPQLSPDGSKIAFIKSFMNKETDQNHSELWMMDRDNNLNLITGEGSSNTSPKWSPDGSKLMYLSNRNGKNEIFITDINTNTTKVVSMDFPTIFPQWSPNGEMIAFFSFEKTGEKTPARYVTRAKQFDDATMTYVDENRKKRLYVYSIKEETITKILPDDFRLEDPELGGILYPSWSSDSSRIAFVGRMQEEYEAEFKGYKANIYVTDLLGNVQGYRDVDGMAGSPIWSADNKDIIFIGHKEDYSHATSMKICKINLETRKFHVLTQEADLHTAFTTLNDCGPWLAGGDGYPKQDGDLIYFLAADRGATNIFTVDINTDEVKKIVGGRRNIYSFSKQGQEIVYAYTSMEEPSQIAIYNIDTAEDKAITSLNSWITEEIILAEQIHFEYKVGPYTTDGWITKPADLKAGESCPTVLSIHGGPYMQYGWAFTFENELFAANGIAVAYTNPRGSRGYTEQFGYELRGHVGTPAYEDLMKFMDIVSTYDFADSERFGVTGQSYGGYMTNWIITQTNRFKAAVPQSSVSNWMTMCGMADMGYLSRRLLLQEDHKELIHLWEMSPMAHVKNVTTPTLFIHCENDYRCPMEQAQQMYTALKWNGCDTKMLRFPNSNHGMLRNGKPSLKEFRLQEMIGYFKNYL